jgi:ubiquinone/menaquinone biosynthesis C-methylase UbiE
MTQILFVFAMGILVLGMAVPSTPAGEEPPPQEGHGHGHHHGDDDDATMHHGFKDPEEWSERWDTPERHAWQEPEKVIDFLQLQQGDTAADIGAGTGYFTVRLARAVGADGTVLAVDIEQEMLDFVAERARREGLVPPVRTVLADPDDPKLPDDEVDTILVVNTWHHIDDRIDYLGRLTRDLAPGGRLVIVDFREGELPVGPPAGHKISRSDLIEEMRRGGFELADELTTLEHQYVLSFRPGS